ncbi:hypothetical protein BGX27_010845, partial [Mortierella sp. AM989]
AISDAADTPSIPSAIEAATDSFQVVSVSSNDLNLDMEDVTMGQPFAQHDYSPHHTAPFTTALNLPSTEATSPNKVPSYGESILKLVYDINELTKALLAETDSLLNSSSWTILANLNASTKESPEPKPAKHIQARLPDRKFRGLEAKADSASIASWTNFFDSHIDLIMTDHRNSEIPFTSESLRQLWHQNLPHTQVYAEFSSLMNAEKCFGDRSLVMLRFRSAFADYSQAALYRQFFCAAWKPVQTFGQFTTDFVTCCEAIGPSEDNEAARGLVAQRFLLCLSLVINVYHVMTQFNDAPPLSKLIKAVMEQTIALRGMTGTGILYRVDPEMKDIIARSKAMISASPASYPASSASGTIAVDNNRRHDSGPSRHKKQSYNSHAARATKPYDSNRSQRTGSSSSVWCFKCNGSQCTNTGYPDRYAFKPLPDGTCPSGGKRTSKLSTSRVLFMRDFDSLDRGTNHHPVYSSEFYHDQYDDDCSLLNARLPLIKSDTLNYLSASASHIIRSMNRDDNSITLPLMIENKPLIALIDTGSTFICRAMKHIDAMLIPADDADEPIQLAHAGTTIKRIDCTSPVLIDADFGVTLYRTVDGEIRFISFVARALHSDEGRCSATQEEMAAIIFALERFRDYV